MIEGIRVFDTVLDVKRNDTVSRNAADFWSPFCKSAGWKFGYERVHSLTDLEYFLSKKINENVIIFSGHGLGNLKGGKVGFHLTNGDVLDGSSNIKIHKENHGKIIIFSACLIGSNEALCKGLGKLFDAEFLFAYRHEVYDRFCFLNESILLTYIEHSTKSGDAKFNHAKFEEFRKQTMFMKNMNKEHVKLHPMRMLALMTGTGKFEEWS